MTIFAAQPQDLGTVRFAWSPAWETLHAVRLFKDPRGRPYHKEWIAAVSGSVQALDLTPLLALNPVRGNVPDFMTPPPRVPAPTIAGQLAEIRATPAAEVAAQLQRCRASLTGTARDAVTRMLGDPEATRDAVAGLIERAWHALVEPFWPTIESLLAADVAHRSRLLANAGLRPVIEGLHERITWSDAGIVIADRDGDVVDLAGRGLVLMPSAFIWPVAVAATEEPNQPAISYPARGIAGLWSKPVPPPDALVRLLGRTRAMLLAALERPASTTALAERHGLSPAGTSRHLIAMRDAGLVRGTRHGHEIRYARTRLGTDLTRASTQRS